MEGFDQFDHLCAFNRLRWLNACSWQTWPASLYFSSKTLALRPGSSRKRNLIRRNVGRKLPPHITMTERACMRILRHLAS
jgi:hypothetical protein